MTKKQATRRGSFNDPKAKHQETLVVLQLLEVAGAFPVFVAAVLMAVAVGDDSVPRHGDVTLELITIVAASNYLCCGSPRSGNCG